MILHLNVNYIKQYTVRRYLLFCDKTDLYYNNNIINLLSLILTDVPKIEVDENLSSQILQVRSQWKVEVKYSGYPRPKITWTKNEQPVEDDKCKIYIDESSTTIAIYSVERASTGTYCVTATNNAGSASANLQLKVIGMENFLHKHFDYEVPTIYELI